MGLIDLFSVLYITARYNSFSGIHLDTTVKNDACVLLPVLTKLLHCTACGKIIVLFSVYYYKLKLFILSLF